MLIVYDFCQVWQITLFNLRLDRRFLHLENYGVVICCECVMLIMWCELYIYIFIYLCCMMFFFLN